MRKTKRALAAALVGILALGILSGCGDEKIIGDSVRLENGEIQENSIVIRVGDTGVRYNEVLGYCYLLKAQYEKSFGSGIWEYALSEETTIGDEAREEIINMITQLKIICKEAEREKVSLTNDERDEALQKAEDILAAASAKDKEEYHLSVQGMSGIYEENALANKMFYIATDDADTNVTDEEARQVKLEMFQIVTKGTAKNGKEISMGTEEKKEARQRASQLRDKAAKADSFLDFAKENTEGDVVELTIGQDTDLLDGSVVTTAFSMKKGSVSPVIGTADGYYVLHCVDDNVEEATYARREAIIEERQTDMFKQKYKQWLGENTVDVSKAFWKIFTI